MKIFSLDRRKRSGKERSQVEIIGSFGAFHRSRRLSSLVPAYVREPPTGISGHCAIAMRDSG